MEWIIENAAILVSAAIGVIGALLGVIITQIVENRRRRKELIDKAKPIVINYTTERSIAEHSVTSYYFETDDDGAGMASSLFKNTDNGILFIDHIETQKKKYYPAQVATADKNTVFKVFLPVTKGENFENCALFGRDIYGNLYRYNCRFDFEKDIEHEIVIVDSMPTLISKAAKSRGRNYA